MAKKYEEFANVYKWNVKDLFKSDEDFLKELKNLDKDIKRIKKYEGIVLKDAHTLLELLELDNELSKRLEKCYIYAHINNDADTLNSKYQEYYGLAKNTYMNYLEITSFIVPELLKSSYKKVMEYIKEEPRLKEYKRSLKEIFRNKSHVLSSEIENVLSMFSKITSAPDEIMGSLTDSDFKFNPIKANGKELELTESNFSVYLRDSNRDIRKQAFQNIYKTYRDYKTTLASILRSEVEKNVTMAKIRKFPSSLDRALFANEIDKKVYLNLIESVHNNLKSLYKYFDLKKKILKVDELHIYDTYTNICSSNNKKYSFEDAKNLVLEVVKPLGEDYVKVITSSFNDGWIDSCNNVGKRGGAYCTACYTVHPYVLMSFEGTLEDVSTLAHELGHAMHYYYACKNNLYQDYDYSIFVAEVASQVNEILLSRYLLDNSDSNSTKLKIIDDLLQKYKSTIYRQTMFAEFELFIHEYTEKGEVLTSDVMCNKYYELNKLYFGNNVLVDDEIRYEWERIPHFYMNFYVYMYATGFVAAVYLANKIYDGDENTRNNYLKFLKLGNTKNPIDSLKIAGVDMTDSKVIDDSVIFMNKLIKEYEELQNNIK